MTKEQQKLFRLDPPVRGEWVTLGDGESALLLSRLRETGFFATEDQPTGPVRVLPLSFYPGWLLCDLPTRSRKSDAADGEEAGEKLGYGAHSLLYGPDGFTALDGNAFQIHEHNRLHGLTIVTKEDLEAYLRFFCFFIHGDDGPFEIAYRGDKFLLAPDDAGVRKTARIKSPRLGARSADGQVREVFATMFYSGELTEIRCLVEATGKIKMAEHTVIATGVTRVPALTFINTLRFQARGTADA